MKYRQNGEAYPKYGGNISNVVCDAGANRHRREHPLPMSAADKQQYTETLLYSPTINRRNDFKANGISRKESSFPGMSF